MSCWMLPRLNATWGFPETPVASGPIYEVSIDMFREYIRIYILKTTETCSVFVVHSMQGQ